MTSAANETKEKYIALCQQRNVEPHEYVLKALNKSAKDFLLSQTDEMCIDLAGNNKLMTQTRLGDDDIDILCSILSKSTVLASLDLQYNNFSDSAADSIAKFIEESPCIKSLNLMCNDMTADGAQKIATALQDNSTLRSLKMNGNKIGNKGGMYFAQALQINSKLRQLDLGDTDLAVHVKAYWKASGFHLGLLGLLARAESQRASLIKLDKSLCPLFICHCGENVPNNNSDRTESIIALSTVIGQNKHLRSINMNRPILFSQQEETTVHISKMLKINHNLRELHISKCDVGDFGVERLCDGLTDNYSLVYLDLSCNKVTRDGAKTLSTLLRKNTPLEILDLGHNRIEDDGAQHISEALAVYNSSLKALVISYNSINGKGLVLIAHALFSNSSLSNIYIWGNNLETLACDAFKSLIDKKRLLQKNTDVRPYEVDGVNCLAEMSHGLRRFYYWTPWYGPDVAGENDENDI